MHSELINAFPANEQKKRREKSKLALNDVLVEGFEAAWLSSLFPAFCIRPRHRLFQVSIPEDTSPWKDILQISAQDLDSNSKLVFSIHSAVPPDSTGLFHLDPKSGVLVMTEPLDFERTAVHTLVVMVML